MPTLSSLEAPQIIVMSTYGAANDKQVIIVTTLGVPGQSGQAPSSCNNINFPH